MYKEVEVRVGDKPSMPDDPKARAVENLRFQNAAQWRRDDIEEKSLVALSETLTQLEELRPFISDPELLIKAGKFLMELTTIYGKAKADETDKLPTVIININRSAKHAASAAIELIEDITPLELNPSALMCTFNDINNELELELDA